MIDAPTTNAQWLTAAKDLSDNNTWEQLSTTYRAPILNHCAKSGLTPQEADEITQETFCQLTLQIEKTGGHWEPKTLRAWLTDIVNRHIIHYFKNTPYQRLSPKDLILVQQWMDPVNSGGVSTEEHIEAEFHLLALSLNRARSQVSPRHWQIFDAYVMRGLSSQEVARHFNTSHFNVRLIAHRIKKVARQSYNQLLSEELITPKP
ncbi:MAG: sigma-70 family RNA polymerase sigma factor [Verrucomicrobia bacterium]|nr:sigma-70 family RNA polymerase sigma factor [Verrucomicrobiota bacterium]